MAEDIKLPPLPWDWDSSKSMVANGSFHVYVIDATKRKIAAIWGRGPEKEAVAKFIVACANQTKTMYVVIEPDGERCLDTIRETEEQSKAAHQSIMEECWSDLERHGAKCVQIKLLILEAPHG